MKAIVCLRCVDIRALRPEGNVVCQCGLVTGRWVDPARGIAKVYVNSPIGREYARVLGIHNGFLKFALDAEPFQNGTWKAAHDHTTKEQSKGYLFSDDNRACWVAMIRPGESSDTSFGDPADL